MKLKLVSATALLFAGTMAFAANAPQKIATVDMQILGETQVCQAPMTDLQNEYKPQFEDLQKQAAALQSSTDKKDQDKLAKLGEQYQNLQQEVEAKAQQADDTCLKAIMAATKHVADKAGYSVVIPQSSALYAANSVDITQSVEADLEASTSKVMVDKTEITQQ